MVAEAGEYDRSVSAVDGERFELVLPDGRLLEGWASDGAARTALLFHVGTPSAGVPYAPWVAETATRGLRFVTYSRPGYAGSTRLPGRAVADCAGDVAAIAGELGLDRLHVVGWSGGGPHALASAALLPALVASAATLAGVAPFGAEGLDWLDGMAEENHEEFGAALAGAGPLEEFLETTADAIGEPTGATIAEALGGLVTDVDRRALTGPFADFLASLMRDALRNGIWGWLDDDLAFARDWGFALDDVSVPVTVWQGREDAMVPYAHGAWLGRNVRGARARLFEDEGHLSLPLRLGEILDDLLAGARAPA
jgi:pimeloyl-ACP methyl ester carboxylesterase